MEETVWLYVGIIAALIGIGVVAQLLSHQNVERHGEMLASAVQSYKEVCNQVCGLPLDSRLSVKAALPAGAVIYSTDDAVCARLGERLFCGRCACPLRQGVALNLSSDETAQYFTSHEFTCSFTNNNPEVIMGCTG